MIPVEWSTDNLSEVADILTGFPFKGEKYSDKGIKVLRGENVSIGFLRWDTEKRWNHSLEGLEKYYLADSDIVIGMDGSRVGQNRAIIKNSDLPLLLAQRVARLRAKKVVDQKYLYYIIFSDKFFNHVESVRTGTSIPHISSKQIGEFIIQVPSLQEQSAIAKILSDLDDKITLNCQMNSTLEAIGQALFKHWFIDFEFPNEEGKPYRSSGGEMVETELGKVPKGWEVKPFSEVIDVNPNRKLVKDRHAKKVGMADLNAWQSWVESWQLEEYKSGPRFQNGDTLFARITPSLEHGKTAFVSFLDKDEVTFGSTEFIIFAPKIIQSNLYIFHLSRSEYVREAAIGAMTGSSGRQRVPDGLFDQLLICVPSLQIIDTFHKAVSPFFEEIAINANQNRNLTTLRDALLPKLMSGEIRVNVEPKEVKNETMG